MGIIVNHCQDPYSTSSITQEQSALLRLLVEAGELESRWDNSHAAGDPVKNTR